ncbi:recombinase family protein [Microbispora hainanensis]|uniref:Recombinase family protein n=1 Tax=Microbispora hainanensis TaxID=568844 RepID=A0ABZ1SSJ4_9ACTN|nr:recombinase family protein [Microbispora hainanensis]
MAEVVPVVSYARISSDGRGDEHGVQDQHKVNRATAGRLGWTIVHEFTDNDKSAAKANVVRDAFEAMVKALRAGRLADGTPIEGVVIVAEDRLARRPGDYERFVEAFTYRDGRVFADARGPKDLYSEDTESMGLFGAVISKMEVRKMQRRMRRSHRARAEQGVPVGGPRPFGWLADRVTIHPEEGPLLREAVDAIIAGGSLRAIVMKWQQLGVRTTRGNEWSRRSLRATLSSPRLCGWREINGELVRDADGNPVLGKWEALITPEELLAVRAAFERTSREKADQYAALGMRFDQREHRYLLSGILRCGKPKADGTGICNAPLRVRPARGGVHLYVCPAPSDGGCGGVGRRGDRVDVFISELVLAKLDESPDADAEDVPWAGEQELKDKKEQLAELTRQWNARTISNELFFMLVPSLEQRINELRREGQAYTAAKERKRSRRIVDGADIRRRWYLPEDQGGLSMGTKRAMVMEAFHAVIVHPVGKGMGSWGNFDPNALEPVWRED